jgi:ABC-2 type transport system permease protein
MLVWVLATTMPFVMLSLWSAVAAGSPVVGASKTWSSSSFVAYFLVMFIVRQLTSSWACWEINFEVRQGTLAMRLLRPIHPIISYAAANLAYVPMRVAVILPVVIGLLLTSGADALSRDWRVWVLWSLSMIGGWAITFFVNIMVGALSMFMESSTKLMDAWLAGYFVFSGYLFPLDLFPGWLKWASTWLPFRFQIGLPVELVTGVHPVGEALGLLAQQWAWVALFVGLGVGLWSAGVRRFQAYGG